MADANTTPLLTPDQMAATLQVKPSTIRSWAREGLIPAIRVGGQIIRFDRDEVLDALRAGRTEHDMGLALPSKAPRVGLNG